MKVRLSIAMVVFASAAAALAACGGGGGGGGFTSIPTSPPSSGSQSTPTPSSGATATPTAAPTSQATAPVVTPGPSSIDAMPAGSTPYGQMTQSQQGTALASLVGTLNSANGIFGTSSSIFATRRAIMMALAHRATSSAPNCVPTTSASESTQSTETTPSGLASYVVYGYPSGDTSCSGAWEYELNLSIAQPSKTGNAGGYVGTGLETFYSVSPSGNASIVGYNQIHFVSISATGSNMQIQGTFNNSLNTVTSAYGATCTTAGCDAATVMNFNLDPSDPTKYPSLEFGAVVNTLADSSQPSIAAYADYPSCLSVKYNEGAYSIVEPQNAASTCVTPTNDQVSMTLTGGNSFDLIDANAGAEVDITINTTGSVDGAVYSNLNGVKGTSKLATISIDQFGSGTLTTSDGTVTPLADFMII